MCNRDFIVLLTVLNGTLATYATPVTDRFDPAEYILLSQSFLGQVIDVNLAHRSPLFSIVLAGLMFLLKPPLAYKVMVIIHYILIAFTSWMVYRLFLRVFPAKWPAMLAALLFNVSFATIAFANLIQTEILTVFLVVLSLAILMKIDDYGKRAHYFALGAVVGLISLARFSAVPIVFVFFVLLLIVLFRQKAQAREWAFSIGTFFVPYLLLINAWCLSNNYHYGFYGLFPRSSGQTVSRNITVSSIRPEYKVSEGNKPVLAIFLKARENYLRESPVSAKGSNSILDKLGIAVDFYGGYNIYLTAGPDLRRHFGLPASAGEYELSQKLGSFYQEISGQNQAFVLKFRFISLLYSFKVSESGLLPSEFGKINLNILPDFFFKIYGLVFAGISLFVFFAFFYFTVSGINNDWNFDFTLLASFFIVFSFWGINFAFVTAVDANRFKFPAEPLIFGLFVYYATQVGQWLTERFRSRRRRHQTTVQ